MMNKMGMSRRGFLRASTAAAAGLAVSGCAKPKEEIYPTEENKDVVRRCVEEIWNQKNTDLIDEIISPDFVDHGMNIHGTSGYEQWLRGTVSLLPDLHETLEHIIAEEDWVANRCLCTGTPTANWFGLPPTGKQVEWRISVFSRIVDGMIAEQWVEWSALDVYQQLGGILTKG